MVMLSSTLAQTSAQAFIIPNMHIISLMLDILSVPKRRLHKNISPPHPKIFNFGLLLNPKYNPIFFVLIFFKYMLTEKGPAPNF